MKDKDDTLKKAVDTLKQEQIPAGPPKDLTETTLEKLNQASSLLPEEHYNRQVVSNKRFIISNLFRIAAAVILSISIGYAAGRISASKSPDMEQIRSELEPAIREKLLEDVQLELANNYVVLREELTEQYQQNLRLAALEILNTSGTITNQLIEELIYAIATAQHQNRQWVAAALEQTELNRLQDKTQLGSALVNFAEKTGQDMALIANFLTNTNIENPNPNELENSNN
ncbi:MAG: hypothetical protein JW787_11795 [Sedimentisphaerales bacterium]|nr:hypothetical protein [Sedimentisphaerales bacterium]